MPPRPGSLPSPAAAATRSTTWWWSAMTCSPPGPGWRQRCSPPTPRPSTATWNGSAPGRPVSWLTGHGHDVDDRGAGQAAGTVDYPPLCADVGQQVTGGRADRGIVIGGTGSGEQIACNKIPGIRAGLCQDLVTTEIARAHND